MRPLGRIARRAALAGPVLLALGVLAVAPGWVEAWSTRADAQLLVAALRAASWIVPATAALAAARFNQSRLAMACLGLAALAHALARERLALDGPGTPALLLAIALAVALAARLDERGVVTRAGLVRLGLLGALVALPARAASSDPESLERALRGLGPALQPTPGTGVPWLGAPLLAAAALACWRARGRDRDVVGTALGASWIGASVAIVLADGSLGAAPVVAPALLLLGAGGACASAVHVVAWRRGYVDDLTGLHGRRALDEALDRLGGAYAVAVVDVDHFKRFNDDHGHDAGDDALRLVAQVLSGVRGGTAYRQGGEEFVLLFPGARLDEAAAALDDLRAAIEEAPLRVRGRRRPLRVTASMGLAERSPRHPDARETLRAADQALLRAKRAGRNRVEVETRRTRTAERHARRPRSSAIAQRRVRRTAVAR